MNKEKKTHGVQLLIRCVVRDPAGKTIQDTGERPSRSFVIQFLEFIYGMFRGVSRNATATDGSEDYYYRIGESLAEQFRGDAGVNNGTHGIVVGTGFTAVTNADYKLETQLTQGAGAGNITHGAMVFEATAVVGANVDLVLKRAFTNATGDPITVKEAGLYVTFTHVGTFYFCIIRDVLAAGIDVPDKCSLTVYYTIRTTV